MVDLCDYINLYNGKVSCKVSLYSFDAMLNGKPVWGSVYIDSLLHEGSIRYIRDIHKQYTDMNICQSIIYNGSSIQLIVYLEEPITRFKLEKVQDERVNKQVDKMILYPNTWNPRVKRYCIPLNGLDLLEGEDYIKEKSQSCVKDFKQDWEGKVGLKLNV
jgi:hypothetical protein